MSIFTFWMAKPGDSSSKTPKSNVTERTPRPSSGNTYITPLTGLAVLTTIFASLTCVPYFAARRHLLRIEGVMHELSTTNRLLRRELSLNASQLQARYDAQISQMKGNVSKLDGQVEWMRKRVGQEQESVLNLQAEMKELIEQQQFGAEQTMALSKLAAALEYKMQRLSGMQSSNEKHGKHIKDIGLTIGEIAAFMHEIEIGYGLFANKDKTKRIERMRNMALHLQSIENHENAVPEEPRKNQGQTVETKEETRPRETPIVPLV